MKKLLILFLSLSPILAGASINHKELVGRYNVSHTWGQLTLTITDDDKVVLFKKATLISNEVNCKSDTYRIKDNVFETVLTCAIEGQVPFRASLAGIDPDKLRHGVAIPITAFGKDLNVNIQRL
jgi:hypothetical protein